MHIVRVIARAVAPMAIGLLFIMSGVTAGAAQAVPPTSAEAARLAADLDSLRLALERMSQQQMQDIQRLSEGRREELDALREALAAQSERMLAAQRDLTQAQRQLAESERQIDQTQRQRIEEVRARLMEEYNRLGDTLRVQGLGADTRVMRYPGWPGVAVLDSVGWPGVAVWDSLICPPGQPCPAMTTIRMTKAFPFVPVSPFFLGSRAVAGAELTDLNPSLARYFDVDQGVLVTQVTDGSQAAEAGILAGDVIVEVNDVAVTSVDGLREVVGSMEPYFRMRTRVGAYQDFLGPTTDPPEPISLGIIREGDRLDLELPL